MKNITKKKIFSWLENAMRKNEDCYIDDCKELKTTLLAEDVQQTFGVLTEDETEIEQAIFEWVYEFERDCNFEKKWNHIA
jgi:hypothetical protein